MFHFLKLVLGAVLLALVVACSNTAQLYENIPETTLKSVQRVVVVPIGVDKIEYISPGFLHGTYKTYDISAWNYAASLSARFASEISKQWRVDAVSYNGTRENELVQVYGPMEWPDKSGLRFKAVNETLRAIKDDAKADLVIVIVKMWVGDPQFGYDFKTRGLVVSSGRRGCWPYQGLMAAALDPKTLEPLASTMVTRWIVTGAKPTAPKILPDDMCEQELQGLRPEQQRLLKSTFLGFVDDETVQNSVGRLHGLPPR